MKYSQAPGTNALPLTPLSSLSEFAFQVIQHATHGRVLSCHARACNLLLHDHRGDPDAVLALVLRCIGDGPLNLVLDGDTAIWSGLEAGAAFQIHDRVLRFNSFSIDTCVGQCWPSRPIIAMERFAKTDLAWLLRLACRLAPCPGLLEALCPVSADPPLHVSAVTALLQHMQPTEPDWLQLASELVGVGPGLTPAGDDFLAGAMIALHQFSPHPDSLCQEMLQRCEGASTRLSLALLERAANGQCSQSWHQLLGALATLRRDATHTRSQLERAVRNVLDHGASSGADTLAGFLYAAACMSIQAEVHPV